MCKFLDLYFALQNETITKGLLNNNFNDLVFWNSTTFGWV